MPSNRRSRKNSRLVKEIRSQFISHPVQRGEVVPLTLFVSLTDFVIVESMVDRSSLVAECHLHRNEFQRVDVERIVSAEFNGGSASSNGLPFSDEHRLDDRGNVIAQGEMRDHSDMANWFPMAWTDFPTVSERTTCGIDSNEVEILRRCSPGIPSPFPMFRQSDMSFVGFTFPRLQFLPSTGLFFSERSSFHGSHLRTIATPVAERQVELIEQRLETAPAASTGELARSVEAGGTEMN